MTKGITRGGIYLNIKESTFIASNGELNYYFTGQYYLEKFLNEYKEHRNELNRTQNKTMKLLELNLNDFFDLALYKKIEKRGFYVTFDNIELTESMLKSYLARNMESNPNSEFYEVKEGE